MKKNKLIPAILALGLLAGWVVWHAFLFRSMGVLASLNDHYVNVIFTRFAIDSLTPGISQIGVVWHPLVQILFLPVLAIPNMHLSPYVGLFVGVPCFVACLFFVFKIIEMCTSSTLASIVCVILFAANPFMVFYSTGVLSEIVFICFLLGGTLFLARWSYFLSIDDLIVCALFIFLAVLTRVEAIVVIPAVCLFVIGFLWLRKKSYQEIAATVLLFGLVSSMSLAIYAINGMVFKNGNPLAFTGFNPFEDGATRVVRAALTWPDVLRIFLYSSSYQFGEGLLVSAGFALLIQAILFVRHPQRIGVLLLPLASMAFIAFSLYLRKIEIAVPEIGSLDGRTPFVDIRYFLPAFLPALLAIGLVVGDLLRSNWLARCVGVLLALVVLAASGQFYVKTMNDSFYVIRNEIQFADDYDAKFMRAFEDHFYDYGKILLATTNNQRFIASSRLPLSRFIQENNYRFFAQAMGEPWIFARWIVIRTTDATAQANALRALTKNPAFQKYYDSAIVTEYREIYKLDDRQLRQAAEKLGINPLTIPSLNPNITTWDPATIYQTMKLSASGSVTP